MMNDDTDALLMGIILEEEMQLSLAELSRACCVHAEYVIDLVEEGIIEPVNSGDAKWRFPGESLKRVRTVANLQKDLGVNLAGVALVLELMAEVEQLRAQMSRLTGPMESRG